MGKQGAGGEGEEHINKGGGSSLNTKWSWVARTCKGRKETKQQYIPLVTLRAGTQLLSNCSRAQRGCAGPKLFVERGGTSSNGKGEAREECAEEAIFRNEIFGKKKMKKRVSRSAWEWFMLLRNESKSGRWERTVPRGDGERCLGYGARGSDQDDCECCDAGTSVEHRRKQV